MDDLAKTMRRFSMLLLFTTILASSASVIVILQQFEIMSLKNDIRGFETSQLEFDTTITAKVLKK